MHKSIYQRVRLINRSLLLIKKRDWQLPVSKINSICLHYIIFKFVSSFSVTGYRFNIHFCILNVHFFRFKVHFFFYTIHFFLFKVHFIFIHKSTYVKISIIKLIVLVQAQVFEKQFKIFCCSVNTFLQVRIVRTNKCISEIPRIFLTIFVKFIYLTF